MAGRKGQLTRPGCLHSSVGCGRSYFAVALMSGRRYVGRRYVSRPYVGRPYVGRPIVLVPTEATRGLNMNMFTGVNLCLRQRRRPTNSREDS